MLPKNIIRVWIQKLSYGCLIFCVGGVGSLAYFDGFLPGHEHDQHPYHLSIFEQPAHLGHHAPSQPEVLAEYLGFRQNLQANFIGAAHNLAPGFAHFFASGLSDGYLLTGAHLNSLHLPVSFASLPPEALKGTSACLAPPEKPPS